MFSRKISASKATLKSDGISFDSVSQSSHDNTRHDRASPENKTSKLKAYRKRGPSQTGSEVCSTPAVSNVLVLKADDQVKTRLLHAVSSLPGVSSLSQQQSSESISYAAAPAGVSG